MVAQLLNEFYRMLHDEGLHMSGASCKRAAEIGHQVCVIYAQLSRGAFDAGDKLWKTTPKIHLFAHLCEWIIPDIGLNPRSYWCYADEDLVGTLVEVGSSCHPSTVPSVGLTKWAILLFHDADA